MATYKVDTTDERLTSIEAQRDKEVSTSNKQFNNMMNEVESQYQGLIGQVEADRKNQEKVINENTDFAIDKIEQQKEQTRQDYLDQQAGAYIDWQKQSDPYGVEAEKRAAAGLGGAEGYLASVQASYYNAYQNRVASARQSYDRAIVDYNNAITEAKLQNNSLLAEIASETLTKKLELTLEGFQYKNDLLLQKASTERNIRQNWQSVYQSMMSTIMDEYRLNEQKRQADLANQREQERIKIAQAELKLQQEKFAYEKDQAAKAAAAIKKSGGSSGGGSKGGSSGGSSSGKTSSNSSGSISKTTTGKATSKASAKKNQNMDLQIDLGSVFALGYGALTPEQLDDMVAKGIIEEYQSGGLLKFRKKESKLDNSKPYNQPDLVSQSKPYKGYTPSW